MLTVKVKFKLDDKVWCIHNNIVKDFIVKQIKVTLQGKDTFIKYTNDAYSSNPTFDMRESDCFATRAALIESLN